MREIDLDAIDEGPVTTAISPFNVYHVTADDVEGHDCPKFFSSSNNDSISSSFNLITSKDEGVANNREAGDIRCWQKRSFVYHAQKSCRYYPKL